MDLESREQVMTWSFMVSEEEIKEQIGRDILVFIVFHGLLSVA